MGDRYSYSTYRDKSRFILDFYPTPNFRPTPSKRGGGGLSPRRKYTCVGWTGP